MAIALTTLTNTQKYILGRYNLETKKEFKDMIDKTSINDDIDNIDFSFLNGQVLEDKELTTAAQGINYLASSRAKGLSDPATAEKFLREWLMIDVKKPESPKTETKEDQKTIELKKQELFIDTPKKEIIPIK